MFPTTIRMASFRLRYAPLGVLAPLLTLAGCRFPELPPLDQDSIDATNAPSDGDIDSPPGIPGGDNIAQLSFPSQWYGGSAASAPDGGVVVSFRHSRSNTTTIGGTTIPCMTCEVILKLSADLDQVEWFAYADASVSRTSLATSPNGSVYWAGEANGDANYTVTFNGSDFIAPYSVQVPGNTQGDDTGGARIVLAFSPSGVPRWVHVLSQTNTTAGMQNYIGGFEGFGAADNAVFSTFAFVRGTLSYTDAGGSQANSAVAAPSYVIHEIDPASGRTVQLTARANTVAGDRHTWIEGFVGYAGKGFILRRSSYDAAGNTTGHAISIGRLSNGAFSPVVDYPTMVATGPHLFKPGRYKNLAIASSPIAGSVTVGPSSYSAPAANGDAFFAVLGSTGPSVEAVGLFGGGAAETAHTMVDARNDDVFLLGGYESTDISIGSVELPDPMDAAATGLFVVRAHVDLGADTLPPVWVRGYTGTSRVMFGGAAADALTGDLYILGAVAAGGSIRLGGGSIDASAAAPAVFVVKLRRGT